MRVASYILGNGITSYGLVGDEVILDAGDAMREEFPGLIDILRSGSLARLEAAATGTVRFADVTMLPPIPVPGKIICVGLNYTAHIKETGREIPTHPSIFTRYPESLVGHANALVRPSFSRQLDFEGELAVVIGRGGRHIARESAFDHIAGYSCFNDGSVRDFQRHTTQFWPGKSFERSGSMGPWLVTSDDIPDPAALHLVTRLNGETVQQAPVADLAFDIPSLVAYISTVTSLAAGDVIATGTPGGVGMFRDPPLWMKPGDKVEVEISGIGILGNTIVDEWESTKINTR